MVNKNKLRDFILANKIAEAIIYLLETETMSVALDKIALINAESIEMVYQEKVGQLTTKEANKVRKDIREALLGLYK